MKEKGEGEGRVSPRFFLFFFFVTHETFPENEKVYIVRSLLYFPYFLFLIEVKIFIRLVFLVVYVGRSGTSAV